uniref:Uncharacterized protein n=1 Tax=Plectus sambesii TaxID=2011161 RepID=A0A914VNF8_9BILA
MHFECGAYRDESVISLCENCCNTLSDVTTSTVAWLDARNLRNDFSASMTPVLSPTLTVCFIISQWTGFTSRTLAKVTNALPDGDLALYRLIELVQSHEALWHKASPDFALGRKEKLKIWSEVTEDFGEGVTGWRADDTRFIVNVVGFFGSFLVFTCIALIGYFKANWTLCTCVLVSCLGPVGCCFALSMPKRTAAAPSA